MRAAIGFVWAVLAVVVFGSQAAAQDQMPWQPTLEAAQQIAARTNRLVLVHFWSPSCKPCTRMESEVFSKPEVASALEPNFVMVKLNVDQSPGTAQLYGVSSIPTDVVTLPNGRLVWQVQSPPAANQYVAQMNQAAAGHRALVQGPQAPAVAAAPPAGVPPTGAPPAAGAPAYGAAPIAPPAAPANDHYAEYFPQPASQPVQTGPAHYPAGGVPQAPPAQRLRWPQRHNNRWPPRRFNRPSRLRFNQRPWDMERKPQPINQTLRRRHNCRRARRR